MAGLKETTARPRQARRAHGTLDPRTPLGRGDVHDHPAAALAEPLDPEADHRRHAEDVGHALEGEFRQQVRKFPELDGVRTA